MVRKSILDLFLNVKIRSQEEIAAMDENAIELEKEKLKNVDTIDLIDYIKQSVEILMHMRMEEFELFKQNWETQERIRKAKLKEEKDNLKKKVTKERAQTCNTKFFDKLKHELLSNDSQSSFDVGTEKGQERRAYCANLDKQARGYQELLIKLEGDVRQHIRVEQQLKLHIEQMQAQSDEIYKQAFKKDAEIQKKVAYIQKLERKICELDSETKLHQVKLQTELQKQEQVHEAKLQ